jgi:Mn2+/Fe2+ NRAMP family transporter
MLFSIVFTSALAVIVIAYPYRKFASLMKWCCLSLLAYFVVPFLLNLNWSAIAANAVLPTVQFNGPFILIVVAILGTTISPYLFFWQASLEVEEDRQRHKRPNTRLLKDMKIDVDLGMIFSNVVMFFIILTTGAVLFANNITNISTVQQAASALRPLAGNASYLLFALGVIGSACIAIPTLGGSLSYVYAEISRAQGSLDKKFRQAKGFYLTLIVALMVGLLIDLAGISPIAMLIYSAVLYGLIAPVLILVILYVCNNKGILGNYVNDRLSNFLGVLTFLVMLFTAAAFLYFQFL